MTKSGMSMSDGGPVCQCPFDSIIQWAFNTTGMSMGMRVNGSLSWRLANYSIG